MIMRGTYSGSCWGYHQLLTAVVLMMISTTANLSLGSRGHITPLNQHQQYNLRAALINVSTSSSTNARRSRRRPPPPPPPPPAFDYLLLVLQWPKSYCHVIGLSPCNLNYYNTTLPRRFTVHGLWPKIYPSIDPPLNNATFDPSQIKNYPVLAKNWMDAKCNFVKNASIEFQTQLANIKFWKEQWEKHGVRSQIPQTDYWKLAMTAYSIHDVTETVDRVVNQRFGQPLNTTELITVISNQLIGAASIHCNRDINNNTQLFEIRIRLRPDGSTLQPLPPTQPIHNCGLQFYLPA